MDEPAVTPLTEEERRERREGRELRWCETHAQPAWEYHDSAPVSVMCMYDLIVESSNNEHVLGPRLLASPEPMTPQDPCPMCGYSDEEVDEDGPNVTEGWSIAQCVRDLREWAHFETDQRLVRRVNFVLAELERRSEPMTTTDEDGRRWRVVESDHAEQVNVWNGFDIADGQPVWKVTERPLYHLIREENPDDA